MSNESKLLKGLLDKFEVSLLDSYLNNCEELSLPVLYPSMEVNGYISAHKALFDLSDIDKDNCLEWPEYKNYMEKVLIQFRDSKDAQVNKLELYEQLKKFRSVNEQNYHKNNFD